MKVIGLSAVALMSLIASVSSAKARRSALVGYNCAANAYFPGGTLQQAGNGKAYVNGRLAKLWMEWTVLHSDGGVDAVVSSDLSQGTLYVYCRCSSRQKHGSTSN